MSSPNHLLMSTTLLEYVGTVNARIIGSHTRTSGAPSFVVRGEKHSEKAPPSDLCGDK